ncbi:MULTISPECIES: DEAD/DEAH box helicase [Kocuria]|uniref:DEAD/DEAH box helicase n=1 Tax=Kocuria subflava TaxID=1736139 RepID=A0A846U8A4_9MICC|nr:MULTISPECIES: DEAD/DEAH box helicase [Kocuria]NKE09816.1 DEAD/DEAH box helicase [Kocuria subflava]
MSSPSERYAAAKQRNAEAKTELAVFAASLDFQMDSFQVNGCKALEDGRGVLVAAPTGAGKTIVGEFAVHLALARGQKAFYTTPIKALSNQKYHDFIRRFGADRVGLLTGDTAVNSEADVVVMTTEVLRNMLYAGSSTLDHLGFVVMDEVHYLADRFRGAVWEEVIIHLPEHVQMACLSATVSNAEEFGDWLDAVRGDTDVVVSEHRPVPLWQHVQVGTELMDLFVDDSTVEHVVDRRRQARKRGNDDAPAVNPELLYLARAQAPGGHRGGRGGGRGPGGRSRDRMARRERGGGGPRSYGPSSRGAGSGGDRVQGGRFGHSHRISRPHMIRRLQSEGLLPAITFIFSRVGCDDAVKQCLAADLWLTTESERQTIRAVVAEAASALDASDLDVLGFYEWRDGLLHGVAAHHAGLLPLFKEVVEQLFAQGLVKAVFATETLALGINMPARSVVLERLDKFNGESRVDITPGEYTQLTGRAGRRGIDVEGHAVVLWRPELDPNTVAGLASKRTYPLISSFRPTYNMSVNLIARFGAQRSRTILESSFAQFQADRSVVGLAKKVRSQEETLAGYEQAMTCHLGDFTEYATLRRELKEAEKSAEMTRTHARRAQAADSLADLRPGDVVDVPTGRNRGYAVVIAADPKAESPRPVIVTFDSNLRRLGAQDLDGPLEPVSFVKLPNKVRTETTKDRKSITAWMRQAIQDRKPARGASGDHARGARQAGPIQFVRSESGSEARIAQLRKALREHPCHGCNDRENHARWAERWNRLRKDTDGLLRQLENRTNAVAVTFDRICGVLYSLDYLQVDDDGTMHPTAAGEQLRHIYGDRDLLLAMTLRDGLLKDLDPAALAATVTALVYQAKREDAGIRPSLPTPAMDRAVDGMIRHWSHLTDLEEQHRVKSTAEPELGLVAPMYRWARGSSLHVTLDGTELAAGDFVRWAKQVIDLLDQIASVTSLDPDVRAGCQRAVKLIHRGVVVQSVQEQPQDTEPDKQDFQIPPVGTEN